MSAWCVGLNTFQLQHFTKYRPKLVQIAQIIANIKLFHCHKMYSNKHCFKKQTLHESHQNIKKPKISTFYSTKSLSSIPIKRCELLNFNPASLSLKRSQTNKSDAINFQFVNTKKLYFTNEAMLSLKMSS